MQRHSLKIKHLAKPSNPKKAVLTPWEYFSPEQIFLSYPIQYIKVCFIYLPHLADTFLQSDLELRQDEGSRNLEM